MNWETKIFKGRILLCYSLHGGLIKPAVSLRCACVYLSGSARVYSLCAF